MDKHRCSKRIASKRAIVMPPVQKKRLKGLLLFIVNHLDLVFFTSINNSNCLTITKKTETNNGPVNTSRI